MANMLCRLLDRTLVKGWKPVIWENLGWHYKAISPCERIKVDASSGIYSALLGAPGDAGGKWSASAETPSQAVRNVVAKAKRELAEIGARIEGLHWAA
jgi:hypothetical protein